MTKRKSTSQKNKNKPTPAKQSATPATAIRHLPSAAELLERKKTEEAAAKAAARAKNAPATVNPATAEAKATPETTKAPVALPPPPVGVKLRTGGSPGNMRAGGSYWCQGSNLPAGPKVAHPTKPGDFSACPECGKILKVNPVKLKSGVRRSTAYHYQPKQAAKPKK